MGTKLVVERTGYSRKRRGVEKELLRYGFGLTSVAAIIVALSDAGVAAILMQENPDDEKLLSALRRRFPRAELRHDPKATRKTVDSIVAFVERPEGNLILPLDIRGTDLQRRIWDAVIRIPFAHTTTFAAIAKQVGAPRAVRAVGNACSQNPLEFAIPCHRVLRSDGAYSGGSAWGDRRQSTLVGREAESVASRTGGSTSRRQPK
jgi:AraC family transcriptional regulator of adaptative response/methylated-DNA-[protein]-cysteine methyltransferase